VSGFNLMAHLPTWQALPADIKAVIERNAAKYVRQQRDEQGALMRACARISPSAASFQRCRPIALPRQAAPCLYGLEGKLGSKCWALLEAEVGKSAEPPAFQATACPGPDRGDVRFSVRKCDQPRRAFTNMSSSICRSRSALRSRPCPVRRLVRIDGVDPVFMMLRRRKIFFRAFRTHDFDICELSMSSFTVKTAERNCPYVGVPAFVSRAFRHNSIYVRTDRIKSPAISRASGSACRNTS